MRLSILVLAFLFAFTALPSRGEEGPAPKLGVLPWKGHAAAFSLTFDDGDPSHLDVAVPELDQRGMKGTFFVIANQIVREEEWRKLPVSGHEIANHSLDHKHAKELDPEGEKSQVLGAKNVLQKKFGIPMSTFAYPFVEITPGLKVWVQKTHLLGRGGGWGRDPILTVDQEPDWWDLPSRTTMTDLPLSVYEQWVEEGSRRGGWTVLMIHGLEGTVKGWEPISREVFNGLLDLLQKKDAWVGTLLEVGAYFRAQKVFERTAPKRTGSRWTWAWKVPEGTPSDMRLKMRIEPTSAPWELRQGDQVLRPDKEGTYEILFSKGSLQAGVLP